MRRSWWRGGERRGGAQGLTTRPSASQEGGAAPPGVEAWVCRCGSRNSGSRGRDPLTHEARQQRGRGPASLCVFLVPGCLQTACLTRDPPPTHPRGRCAAHLRGVLELWQGKQLDQPAHAGDAGQDGSQGRGARQGAGARQAVQRLRRSSDHQVDAPPRDPRVHVPHLPQARCAAHGVARQCAVPGAAATRARTSRSHDRRRPQR